MNINRKPTPIRFDGEVKNTSVTLTTNIPLADANAELACVGEDRGCNLRILRCKGCETVVQLPEDIALLGAGHYEIVLYDGCEECDRRPVIITANCYITSMETKTATKPKNCVMSKKANKTREPCNEC